MRRLSYLDRCQMSFEDIIDHIELMSGILGFNKKT